MLTRKQLFVLFVLSLIPLAFYLQREDIIGFDGYHFMSYICQHNYIDNGTIEKTPPLSKLFFSIFPCNIFAVKLFLWFLLFVSTVIIAMMGKLFHEEGWLAGIFVYLSLLFPMEFLKFEDDQLAFPILFLAMYFFLKGVIEKKKKHQVFAFGLVLLGGMLWKGAISYAFAFAMFYPMLFLFSVVLSNAFPSYNFFGSIFPDWNNLMKIAVENWPLLGLAMTGVLAWSYLWIEPILLFPVIFFTVVVLFKAQLAIHLVPLLAVSFVNKFRASEDILKIFLVAFAVSMLFYTSLSIPNQMPTQGQKTAVKNALEYSDEIKNDWMFAYLIEWYGGTPKYMEAGGLPDYDFSEGIILTRSKLDCELLNWHGEYNIYRC